MREEYAADESQEKLSEVAKPTDHESLLKTAHERFQRAEEAERDMRLLAREDLLFSKGEQWPEETLRSRAEDKRPCLVINRIPQFIHQITNDQRQNRPAIKVSPVDDKADIETAKILQGLVRHIEYESNADTAYDTAFDSAVRTSFGFFRVVTEYDGPLSFDQRLRIKRIKNRFAAYLDPSYQEPDGSDAKWGFVFDDIPKEEFKALYPNSEMCGSQEWGSFVKRYPDWVTENNVRVAEYFYTELTPTKICLIGLPDGSTASVEKSEIPEGARILKERETIKEQIKWCKLTATDVLEETDWPGQWIPIIPVLGDELDIDGVRHLESVVRHAKDPQRMYNYWKSSETETIALAPRAPFVGAAGQFKGFESKWRTANQKNHPYLEYNPIDIEGSALPAPQRQAIEPAVGAITMAGREASEDMKATTGIYDAALGARSNENSGVAIQRRNQQAQTSNFHFVDNLSKSIRHCGRILVDLIPKIYDTARAVRILGEDGTEEIVRINELFERDGKPTQYNLGAGKYDVTLDDGPSYQTRRQEAAATQLEMARTTPKVMEIGGDIVLGNMDIPGAKDLAERWKKTLPPGIADEGDEAMPPQAKAKLDQAMQLVDQLTAKLNEATEEVKTKKIELESKERIEMKKLETQVALKLAELEAQDARVLLETEIANIKDRLNRGLDYQEPLDEEQPEAAGGPAMAPPIQEPQEQPQMSAGAQVPGAGEMQ